jgi:hypothetical protein
VVDLRAAINTRRLVSFSYDGHARIVIPAAYGRRSSTGNMLLRAYQVGGTDKTRSIPAWSLFREDKMINAQMLDEQFDGPPPGYRRGDRDIDVILAQL